MAELPVIEATPSSSTQDLQGPYNNLGLAELEALVTTGHGLSTTELQQIKARAILIREVQSEIHGTKRSANDDSNLSLKDYEVKYIQVKILKIRATLRDWADWKSDL